MIIYAHFRGNMLSVSVPGCFFRVIEQARPAAPPRRPAGAACADDARLQQVTSSPASIHIVPGLLPAAVVTSQRRAEQRIERCCQSLGGLFSRSRSQVVPIAITVTKLQRCRFGQ